MVTHDANAIVGQVVDTGEELWRIEATEDSDLVVKQDMIGVVTTDGDTATIDVYWGYPEIAPVPDLGFG